MKNELLKNKISESIASKTVSDNLIYLSMAMIKYKDKSNKYIKNMIFLLNAAAKNGITKDTINEKFNSVVIGNYSNCISLNQALAISYICRDGNYTYDKNYLPDAVCGFISDEEFASMLKDFGFSSEDNVSNDIMNKVDNTSETNINQLSNTNPVNTPYLPDRMKYIYKIIDNLTPVLWHGKKVIITSQAKQVFDVSDSIIYSRFKKFKDKFKLGIDYYYLEYKDVKTLYNLGYFDNANLTHTYCWTQSGTLLLAKSLNNYNFNKDNKYMKIYQYLVEKYFSVEIKNEIINKQELIGIYAQSSSEDNIQIISDTTGSNQPESLTPIEIALGIDADGMTTARKLYEFLEMRQGDYARWCKKNITENPFAIENEDYEVLRTNAENPKGGRPTQDFKLTANFAKKLSMQGKTDRAEQAREYFIRVEDKLKEVVVNNSVNDSILKTQKQYSEQYQTNKVKHYTSSTPIPKIKDSLGIAKVRKLNNWFYNNNYKIEKILDSFGWERSYLYHIILKTIGQEYDLKAAERIYEKELGISVEYAMDTVEYFNVLSQAATEILNKMVNGVINVN